MRSFSATNRLVAASPGNSRGAFRCPSSLMGESCHYEMHVGINEARKNILSTGVYELFSGERIELLPHFNDSFI